MRWGVSPNHNSELLKQVASWVGPASDRELKGWGVVSWPDQTGEGGHLISPHHKILVQMLHMYLENGGGTYLPPPASNLAVK